MNAVTRSLVSAQLLVSAHVTGLVERVSSSDRDRGQASAEYAGIIFVIVAVIAAVAGAGGEIGDAIVTKIKAAVETIHG